MKSVLGLAAALLLCACSTSIVQESRNELPIITVVKSEISGIETPKTVVVRDQANWNQLWSEHSKNNSRPMPSVDFTKSMVLGVVLGARPNGCYSVSIEKIRRVGERLIAEYSEFTSLQGGFCTFGMTNPSHFVMVPRHPGVVEFIKKP